MNSGELLQAAKELTDHIRQAHPQISSTERDAILTLALLATDGEEGYRAAHLLQSRGFSGA